MGVGEVEWDGGFERAWKGGAKGRVEMGVCAAEGRPRQLEAPIHIYITYMCIISSHSLNKLTNSYTFCFKRLLGKRHDVNPLQSAPLKKHVFFFFRLIEFSFFNGFSISGLSKLIYS